MRILLSTWKVSSSSAAAAITALLFYLVNQLQASILIFNQTQSKDELPSFYRSDLLLEHVEYTLVTPNAYLDALVPATRAAATLSQWHLTLNSFPANQDNLVVLAYTLLDTSVNLQQVLLAKHPELSWWTFICNAKDYQQILSSLKGIDHAEKTIVRSTFIEKDLNVKHNTSINALNGLNDTHHTPSLLNVSYEIETSGWVVLQLYQCHVPITTTTTVDNDTAVPTTATIHNGHPAWTLAGQLVVETSYGTLPAKLIGLYLFAIGVTVVYTAVTLVYTVVFMKHAKTVTGLQVGILILLWLLSIASACCAWAFDTMNRTGKPLCCPYSFMYSLSIVISSFGRTIARVLLLAVCLGVGVTPEGLSRRQLGLIVMLGGCYMVSTLGDQVTKMMGTISLQESSDAASSVITFPPPGLNAAPNGWGLAEFGCNFSFMMWSYAAVEMTTATLRATKQQMKLALYQSLGNALTLFLAFFFLLTTVEVLQTLRVIGIPPEWDWGHFVVWPVLNLIIVTSMAVIWRPSASSTAIATSMQLRMTESSEYGSDSEDEGAHESSEDEMEEIDLAPPV